jgi:CubicO group peptidase (beta-lactamase class C family)
MTKSTFFRRCAALIAASAIAVSLASGNVAAAADSPPELSSTPDIAENAEAAPTLNAANLKPWLDGFLPEALHANKVAGASVVVVKDGQVILNEGYGYADVASKAPIDPQQTTFRPASISKLFVVTALMQLVEEGKVSLDENINTYLDFPIDGKDNSAITVRHLITHTAGFEETGKNPTYDDPNEVPALENYVKENTPNRIFKPGSTPAYSNYGMTVVGYIIQRVSGMSFDDHMDSRIFAPLGMSSSSFRQPPPPALLEAASQGYIESDQAPIGPEYFSDAPAGSLTSTPGDMAKFMIEHLQNEQAGKGILLKPETATEMHRTITRKFPELNGMALGFYQANRNGRQVIAHGGDLIAFHSDLNLFIDDNVGVFISMNSAGSNATDVRQRLITSFADRYFPDESAQDGNGPVDTGLAREHAQEVAGEYTMSRGAKTTFLKIGSLLQVATLAPNDDGTLTASFGPLSYRLTEVKPYLWQEPGTDLQLQVKKESDGSTVMSFSASAPIITFTRALPPDSPAFVTLTAGLALLVLVLTLVSWPLAALVRRRYRVSADWKPQEFRSIVARRIGSVALLVPAIAWTTLIVMPLAGGTPPTDGLVIGVQVVTIAGVGIAALTLAVSLIDTVRKSRRIVRWAASLTWAAAMALVIFQYYNFNMLLIDTTY